MYPYIECNNEYLPIKLDLPTNSIAFILYLKK